MTNKQRGRFIAIIIVSVVILSGVGYWTWNQVTKLPVVSAAPAFTLENLEGEEVQLSDLDGKVRVMEFFFANCPDICPMTTAKLVNVQNELNKEELFGKEVVFIAVTFDPVNDTPEVLKEYIDKHGMDPAGWVLLRGTEESTKQVAQSFGVGVQKISEGNFIHSVRDAVFLIDPKGSIRKEYDMGQDTPSDEILKDIKSVLKKG